jgi:hypothetical protein
MGLAVLALGFDIPNYSFNLAPAPPVLPVPGNFRLGDRFGFFVGRLFGQSQFF